jgi:SPP1 family predicted phage head-tail adaptor
MIPAGMLNAIATLQKKSVSTSATSGQQVETWTSIGSIRCRIDEASGREFQFASGKKVNATHVLFANLGSVVNVTEKDYRISNDGKFFDILLISNAGGALHHKEILLQVIF